MSVPPREGVRFEERMWIMRLRLLVWTAAVAALFAVAGYGLGLAQGLQRGQPPVDCPTEDSCEVDYRDGRWHITPVTP